MTPASTQSLSDDSNALPLARIYAEEESFIFPLREYLEAHSCEVRVNPEQPRDAIYTIIAGSQNFVKYIYATQDTNSLRCIGIVVTLDPNEGKFFTENSKRIVVVDPRVLTADDVEKIFSFFFSSSDLLLNITRNIHEQPSVGSLASNDAVSLPEPPNIVERRVTSPHPSHPLSVSPVDTPSVLSENDSVRISTIMNEVFSETTSAKKKKRKQLSFAGIRTNFFSLVVYSVFFSGIFLFPMFTYFGSISIASIFMANAANAALRTDIQKAQQSLATAEHWLIQGKIIFSVFSVPLRMVGATSTARGQERFISLLFDLSHGMKETIKVAEQGKKVATVLIPSSVLSEDKLPASTIESLNNSVTSSHSTLGLAQAELTILLREQSFPFSIPILHTKASELLTTLQSARTVLSYAHQFLTVYPKIAGFKKPQSILILLQNSNELRPTGGFIGSVAVATLEDGGLSDFVIEDIYALDGQLKGHVDPPKPIAELLGNEHWYMRDSNWDPDFKESAGRAAWFYEKETGKSVDGVIAINIPIVVELLKAIGPVQLPDYGDRITAENFFGKSLYYTQQNFFPGSTQKRDFLGSLVRASMTKIMTDRDIDGFALMKTVIRGLESRDVLVYLQDAELQSTVEYFGWGGRVYTDPLCSGIDKNRCLSDEVLISEANVSVSKVNYYITHKAMREITLSPKGEIQERVSYVIGNTVNTAPDPNEKGVGGPYQTYIRFLLPKDSIINTVTLDGIPIPSRSALQKTAPAIPYIENSDGAQPARSIGVVLRIMPGEEKDLQMTYSRGVLQPLGKGGGYLDLLWYKHPGVSNMPLQTKVKYPSYWTATNEVLAGTGQDGEFIAKESEFEYNTHIQRDTRYRIKFIQ